MVDKFSSPSTAGVVPLAAAAFFGAAAVWLLKPRGSSSSQELEAKNGSVKESSSGSDGDIIAATWSLPHVLRENNKVEAGDSDIEHILKRFEVSPTRGFLPHSDPLQKLPAKYRDWEVLSQDLSGLILARQIRHLVDNLPVISLDELTTQDQLRRAHLILCCLAHAYVWATAEPADTIPKGVAVPLCAISDKLSLPPILSHTDIVLYNWRRLDKTGSISLDNLTTLSHISGGPDEAWFYEVTVEIEAVGAPAVLATLLAQDAIVRFSQAREKKMDSRGASDEEKEPSLSQEEIGVGRGNSGGSSGTKTDQSALSVAQQRLSGELTRKSTVLFVIDQLKVINQSVSDMVTSLKKMNQGCMPFIFYHRIRPFLSGWKSNPSLPDGIVYEGVKGGERQFYYGGSAAQSPLLPFLDISLGVSHANSKSQSFLLAMRDYMLKPHREFLEQQSKVACIRGFVKGMLREHGMDLEDHAAPVDSRARAESSGRGGAHLKPGEVEERGEFKGSILDALKHHFNCCIANLQQFRDAHMKIVHVYIIAQQKMLTDGPAPASAGADSTGSGPSGVQMSPPRGDILRTGITESPVMASGARKFVEAATGDPLIAKTGSDTSLAGAAGGKGTGGTDLMKFLRPIRDSVAKTHIK